MRPREDWSPNFVQHFSVATGEYIPGAAINLVGQPQTFISCRCQQSLWLDSVNNRSLRPTKSLLEVLELLVDGLLGGFHLDEAVDEALAVGFDPLF